MAEYLIKNRVLQPSSIPTRLTSSNILLANPGTSGNPWAIGTGGDAGSPPGPDAAVPPALLCEMQFDPATVEAAICWVGVSTSEVGTFGLSASYFRGESVELAVRMNWSGETTQVKSASIPVAGPLSLRMFNGAVQLVDEAAAVLLEFTEAELTGFFDPEMPYQPDQLLPIAFSATHEGTDSLPPHHCRGVDAVIDVVYDGLRGEEPSAFWMAFNQTREVI